MVDAIHQEVVLAAAPARVYQVLMDSVEHAAFTANGSADISREVGGAFSTHGGHITGRNIELDPGRRIVQAWRVRDWPEGVYSVIRFDLRDEEGKTRLVFDQWGAPGDQRAHLAEGWDARYWRPLRTYLES